MLDRAEERAGRARSPPRGRSRRSRASHRPAGGSVAVVSRLTSSERSSARRRSRPPKRACDWRIEATQILLGVRVKRSDRPALTRLRSEILLDLLVGGRSSSGDVGVVASRSAHQPRQASMLRRSSTWPSPLGGRRRRFQAGTTVATMIVIGGRTSRDPKTGVAGRAGPVDQSAVCSWRGGSSRHLPCDLPAGHGPGCHRFPSVP